MSDGIMYSVHFLVYNFQNFLTQICIDSIFIKNNFMQKKIS